MRQSDGPWDRTKSARGAPNQEQLRLAYVCSHYPLLSHSFILREVEALRALGAELSTFSVRRSDPAMLLSSSDRQAFVSTYALLPTSWRALASAHLRLFVTRPRRYLRTLGYALRSGPRTLRGPLWQLFYFAEAGLLWAQCHERELHHIHAHLANVGSDVALLAARLGGGSGQRAHWSWSFTMHGPDEFFDTRHFRLAEKVRDANVVVCISDFTRSQLMSLVDEDQWHKLRVIRCGIPTANFQPDEAEHEAEPEILCVGRLVPQKGHGVLLGAVSLLRDRGHPVRVVLVGTGPTREALERQAERLRIDAQVVFAGPVGQDAIKDLYARASVFCLPSFAEGLPIVLMEAMAMGLPAVSTRINGIPELVEDGRSGYLVAPGRADELADALERIIVDPALGRRFGRAGREKVLKEFDVGRSARQLDVLFRGLLGIGTPGSRPSVNFPGEDVANA